MAENYTERDMFPTVQSGKKYNIQGVIRETERIIENINQTLDWLSRAKDLSETVSTKNAIEEQQKQHVALHEEVVKFLSLIKSPAEENIRDEFIAEAYDQIVTDLTNAQNSLNKFSNKFPTADAIAKANETKAAKKKQDSIQKMITGIFGNQKTYKSLTTKDFEFRLKKSGYTQEDLKNLKTDLRELMKGLDKDSVDYKQYQQMIKGIDNYSIKLKRTYTPEVSHKPKVQYKSGDAAKRYKELGDNLKEKPKSETVRNISKLSSFRDRAGKTYAPAQKKDKDLTRKSIPFQTVKRDVKAKDLGSRQYKYFEMDPADHFRGKDYKVSKREQKTELKELEAETGQTPYVVSNSQVARMFLPTIQNKNETKYKNRLKEAEKKLKEAEKLQDEDLIALRKREYIRVRGAGVSEGNPGGYGTAQHALSEAYATASLNRKNAWNLQLKDFRDLDKLVDEMSKNPIKWLEEHGGLDSELATLFTVNAKGQILLKDTAATDIKTWISEEKGMNIQDTEVTASGMYKTKGGEYLLTPGQSDLLVDERGELVYVDTKFRKETVRTLEEFTQAMAAIFSLNAKLEATGEDRRIKKVKFAHVEPGSGKVSYKTVDVGEWSIKEYASVLDIVGQLKSGKITQGQAIAMLPPHVADMFWEQLENTYGYGPTAKKGMYFIGPDASATNKVVNKEMVKRGTRDKTLNSQGYQSVLNRFGGTAAIEKMSGKDFAAKERIEFVQKALGDSGKDIIEAMKTGDKDKVLQALEDYGQRLKDNITQVISYQEFYRPAKGDRPAGTTTRNKMVQEWASAMAAGDVDQAMSIVEEFSDIINSIEDPEVRRRVAYGMRAQGNKMVQEGDTSDNANLIRFAQALNKRGKVSFDFGDVTEKSSRGTKPYIRKEQLQEILDNLFLYLSGEPSRLSGLSDAQAKKILEMLPEDFSSDADLDEISPELMEYLAENVIPYLESNDLGAVNIKDSTEVAAEKAKIIGYGDDPEEKVEDETITAQKIRSMFKYNIGTKTLSDKNLINAIKVINDRDADEETKNAAWADLFGYIQFLRPKGPESANAENLSDDANKALVEGIQGFENKIGSLSGLSDKEKQRVFNILRRLVGVDPISYEDTPEDLARATFRMVSAPSMVYSGQETLTKEQIGASKWQSDFGTAYNQYVKNAKDIDQQDTFDIIYNVLQESGMLDKEQKDIVETYGYDAWNLIKRFKIAHESLSKMDSKQQQQFKNLFGGVYQTSLNKEDIDDLSESFWYKERDESGQTLAEFMIATGLGPTDVRYDDKTGRFVASAKAPGNEADITKIANTMQVPGAAEKIKKARKAAKTNKGTTYNSNAPRQTTKKQGKKYWGESFGQRYNYTKGNKKIIKVDVPGASHPLLYSGDANEGDLVEVPFGKGTATGTVIGEATQDNLSDFSANASGKYEIKSISKILPKSENAVKTDTDVKIPSGGTPVAEDSSKERKEVEGSKEPATSGTVTGDQNITINAKLVTLQNPTGQITVNGNVGSGSSSSKTSYSSGKDDDDKQSKTDKQELRELEVLYKQRTSLRYDLAKYQKRYNLTSPLSREIPYLEEYITTQSAALEDVEAELAERIKSGGFAKDIIEDLNKKYSDKDIRNQLLVGMSHQGSQNLFQQIGTSFKNMLENFTQMGAAYKIIGMLRNSMSKIVTAAQQLDKTMVDLRIVTGNTKEETNELMSSYSKLGGELSATTTEVANAANSWLRQGYSIGEVNDLISASMHLSKLGMIESGQATEYLTSMLKGFKLEASDAMDVVSKLTKVDMEAATSAGSIAESLRQFATTAQLSGVDIDQAIAMATTIMDVSQKDASSVGHALNTMIARYGNVKAGAYTSTNLSEESSDTTEKLNDIEKVLNKIGISMRTTSLEFRDFDEVLEDVAAKWQDLDNVSQNAIA